MKKIIIGYMDLFSIYNENNKVYENKILCITYLPIKKL